MALLDILYRDEHIVAIHKPDALLVHRTRLSGDRLAALQILRDQINRTLYPVHRLDRATSGVLLFALDSGTARLLGAAFTEHQITKTYRAIVRGNAPSSGVIDHPVIDPDDPVPRSALTQFKKLENLSLDEEVDGRPVRYSLLEIQPQTGRRHQIRRHLKHINHPIIGDTVYGRGPQNRFFRDRFGVHRLLLHARALELEHPHTGAPLRIEVEETEERSWRLLREQTAGQWTPCAEQPASSQVP